MAQALLAGQYDWRLVGLSFIIAFCASLTSVELAGRSVGSDLSRRRIWFGGGALCVGIGLWSVRDLGLLAFSLPSLVPQTIPAIAASLSVAAACSFVAIAICCWRPLPDSSALNSILTLGAGLAAMLFSAIEAMRLTARPSNSLGLMAVSIATAATAPLLVLKFGRNRLVAAGSMAAASVIIEYSGLIAVQFHVSANGQISRLGATSGLAADVVIATVALLVYVAGMSALVAAGARVMHRQHNLQESEQERWRLVIDVNQDGVYDFDLISGAVFYSSRWKEIIGYGPDELEDKVDTWQQRIHPDDKSKVDAAIEEYLRSCEGSLETEYRLRHKDGGYRWILARSQAVWDEKGKPIRLVGSHCDITDRKRALDHLSASEARFSVFMQHSPILGYIKDADGRFIYTNATLERVWKLKPGAWIGRTNSDIWPEAMAKRVSERDREVMAAQARSEMIEELDMPDGSVHQFLTARFSFPEAGGGRLLGGVSIDISERMRTEERLRVAESRYRELFEHNLLPIWIYRTRDLRILNVNQAAIDHYGWSRAQFLNLTVRSLCIDDVGEPLTGNEKFHKTDRIRHRRNSKSDIWVELSSQAFEAGGTMLRLVMAHDVTDHIAYQEALRREQGALDTAAVQRIAELERSVSNWQNIVQALPQITWSARPDGFCEYISQQLADYTGVPTPELIGWGWLRFVHVADREKVRVVWADAARDLADYEVEYRIRSERGEYRWFSTRGRCIRTTGGQQIANWLGTTTDIENQHRHAEQLEAAIAERMLALDEVRHQASIDAKSKGEFLAAVSNGLRTPMNKVVGMAKLMLDTELTPQQCAYVETITSCGQSVLGLLSDVLDFSRVEPGNGERDQAEFDLQTLLEESVELVAASLTSRNLQLLLSVGEGIPFSVVGDAPRLRQVLLHLLANAVKLTGEGTVTLSVTTVPAERNALMLRFSVQETGTADAGSPTGTGLGLSMARRLVSLMSGTLGVVIECGEDSTFWFSVPMTAAAWQVNNAFDHLVTYRILLCTASVELSQKVRGYLQRAGLDAMGTIQGANTASNGNGNYFVEPVSLLITDSITLRSMPETDLQKMGKCPVLILGSPAGLSDHALSLKQGSEYMALPIRCVPLLRAVGRLLNSRSVRAEDERGRMILLVEDDHISQMITKLFLEQMGYQVTLASNGAAAYAAVRKQPFDLILMDCQMPHMDGFEAARAIRKFEAIVGAHTPIVALSAGVFKEERDQCYTAGMDDFLSKPLNKLELEAVLYNWLTERRSARQTAGA